MGVVKDARFTAIYYSDMRGDEELLRRCLYYAWRAVNRSGGRLVTVTLSPITFAIGAFVDKAIVYDGTPSLVSIFNQILKGLDEVDAGDTVFLLEHDVLYPEAYFGYMTAIVEEHEEGYAGLVYNTNVYCMNSYGFFPFRDYPLLSNLAGESTIMREAIESKLARAEADTLVWSEPGMDDTYNARRVVSTAPTVDIRHGRNLTGDRCPPEGVEYIDTIPTWGAFERYIDLLGVK